MASKWKADRYLTAIHWPNAAILLKLRIRSIPLIDVVQHWEVFVRRGDVKGGQPQRPTKAELMYSVSLILNPIDNQVNQPFLVGNTLALRTLTASLRSSLTKARSSTKRSSFLRLGLRSIGRQASDKDRDSIFEFSVAKPLKVKYSKESVHSSLKQASGCQDAVV